jgi:hypothetical protein
MFAWLVTFGAGRPARAERLYGLGDIPGVSGLKIITFDSVTPGLIVRISDLTGVRPNEFINGIDFRPATGQLYGLSGSSIYLIDPETGVATFVATLSSTLVGGITGVDFDPVKDRLRVDNSIDLRTYLINVDTGEVTDEGDFRYPDSDLKAFEPPNVTGLAYSNNFAGATSTTLFGIDSGHFFGPDNQSFTMNLVRQDPPQVVRTVGLSGSPLNRNNTGLYGFDISGLTGAAYVVYTPDEPTNQLSRAHLFTINLATGEARDVGAVGDQDFHFLGLAAPVAPRGESIDDARAYVRRHYYDFLSRDPDASGLDFWTDQIESCGTDQQCVGVKRINVSAAFFLSTEFQQTGCLAYRTYQAAFGNMPGAPVPLTFFEFLAAKQQLGEGVVIGQAGADARLEENKVDFFNSFVLSRRFREMNLLPPAEFVDTLNLHTGLSLTAGERGALVGELSATGTAGGRARVLRKVAENTEFKRREMNRAFVLMEYFGYLRRDPADPPERTLDYQGYNYWLGKLNGFNGDFVEAEMVKAFIDSIEYRKRFGQ